MSGEALNVRKWRILPGEPRTMVITFTREPSEEEAQAAANAVVKACAPPPGREEERLRIARIVDPLAYWPPTSEALSPLLQYRQAAALAKADAIMGEG